MNYRTVLTISKGERTIELQLGSEYNIRLIRDDLEEVRWVGTGANEDVIKMIVLIADEIQRYLKFDREGDAGIFHVVGNILSAELSA